jgi:hypothetical protein
MQIQDRYPENIKINITFITKDLDSQYRDITKSVLFL